MNSVVKRLCSGILHRFASTTVATATPAISTTPRIVGHWLGLTSGLVFGMVVVGGATRLTQSGLSMVEWKFTGEKLPRSAEEWERMFDKYKQYPEYKKKNFNMTVDEFKNIFYWEYGHRMMGRAIGVVYGLPMLYFAAKGYLNNGPVRMRCAALLGMGAAQGLLGWYMVKSGLDEKTIVGDVPTVSPYRLAAHLLSAFTIYSVSLWTCMDILWPKNKEPSMLKDAAAPAHLAKLARMTKAGLLLVIVTITAGAFVAGLDAGYIYNEFPLMGGHVVPPDYMALEPKMRNFTENPANVQFSHRCLAILTLGHIIGMHFSFKRINRKLMNTLPNNMKRAFTLFAGMAVLQVSLGITALLTHVPVPIGVAHQSGSLMLLSFGLYALHTIKRIR